MLSVATNTFMMSIVMLPVVMLNVVVMSVVAPSKEFASMGRHSVSLLSAPKISDMGGSELN
jgi:hypothetical protein